MRHERDIRVLALPLAAVLAFVAPGVRSLLVHDQAGPSTVDQPPVHAAAVGVATDGELPAPVDVDHDDAALQSQFEASRALISALQSPGTPANVTHRTREPLRVAPKQSPPLPPRS